MPFALYEAGGGDATFILIDSSTSYETIETKQRLRSKQRMNNGRGPIAERRIVPHEDFSFPLHAELDELLKLINEYNELYPE